MHQPERYNLQVEVTGNSHVSGDVLLRRALKCLLRSFNVKCLSISPIKAPAPRRTPRSRKSPGHDPVTLLAFAPPMPGELEGVE